LQFSDSTHTVIDGIESEIARRVTGQATLEAAGQALCDILYETFEEPSVLVRAFVTVPYARLPVPNQVFVHRLVGPGASQLLRPQTPVLSLLGTRGKEPSWNSRHESAGHAGIPLASVQFVDAIPMIARLLKELGARIEWADELDTAIVSNTLRGLAGTFYVDEAAEAVDQGGRKIIVAEDFVRAHGVRTVFGFGGSYPVERTFLAVVVFTREFVDRQIVDRFMRLASSFKTATLRAALERRVFVDDPMPGRPARAGPPLRP
jgi:hypothetical protein